MSRRVFWAALAVAGAVLAGCGPEKDIPAEIPKGTEPADPAQARPTVSEPAAKAFVNKALHKYTGGKLEEVAKGKSSRLKLKGKELWPGDAQKLTVDASRALAAVWPDRFHGRDDLQGQGRSLTIEVWLRRPHVAVAFGGQEQSNFNPVELEKNLAADVIGQHWLVLFLPLIDPKAVVYDLKAQTDTVEGGKPRQLQTLKLALPDFPIYELTFDAETYALLRVDYSITELGRPVRRAWSMRDHKVGPEGLLLPSKMECRWDNEVKEEWVEAVWQFPDKIADEEFSPPRK